MGSELTGSHATKAEITGWTDRLRTWASPSEFEAVVDGMREKLGDRSIDQPGVPFRDAFIALRCARSAQASRIRLGEDPPDFQLEVETCVISFEAVEAMRPGRRRGDELNTDRLLPDAERRLSRPIPDEEFLPVSLAVEVIAAAVRQKASKRYAAGTVLVVYDNLGFSQNQQRLDESLEEAIAAGFPAFAEIWLLSNGDVKKFLPT